MVSNKGNGKMVYIFIDLEMNPAFRRRNNKDVSISETIQIGAVKTDKNFKPIDSFSAFVKPEMTGRITKRIRELTGITPEQTGKAEPLREVLPEFLKWAGTEKAVFISWSKSDYIQLKKECAQKRIPFPESMREWADAQWMFSAETTTGNGKIQCMGLGKAAESIGIGFDKDNAHKAGYDAKIMANIIRVLSKKKKPDYRKYYVWARRNAPKKKTAGKKQQERKKRLKRKRRKPAAGQAAANKPGL